TWFIARLEGLFPDSISGHSLQAGGATSLAASVCIGLISQFPHQNYKINDLTCMGHWSSDTFHIYIHKNLSLLHIL
ncbi:hypothetical protein BDR05DRAFT_835209, partial [Suillus weaverae]